MSGQVPLNKIYYFIIIIIKARLAVDHDHLLVLKQIEPRVRTLQWKSRIHIFKCKNKHLVHVIFMFAFIYTPSPSQRLVQGDNVNIPD